MAKAEKGSRGLRGRSTATRKATAPTHVAAIQLWGQEPHPPKSGLSGRWCAFWARGSRCFLHCQTPRRLLTGRCGCRAAADHRIRAVPQCWPCLTHFLSFSHQPRIFSQFPHIHESFKGPIAHPFLRPTCRFPFIRRCHVLLSCSVFFDIAVFLFSCPGNDLIRALFPSASLVHLSWFLLSLVQLHSRVIQFLSDPRVS